MSGINFDTTDLWSCAVEVFRRQGAEVVLGEDNLIMTRRPADSRKLPFVVIVEGLPNLLHELIHLLFAGGPADDHGIDYHQIPYDLTRPAHRQVLWEELSCCVISSAYLPPEKRDPWFAEQIGIQGVFYGFDDDVEEFYERVETVAREYAQDLQMVTQLGYRRVDDALAQVGASRSAREAQIESFADYWGRFSSREVA
ncbi:MAG: hypothetical protein ACPG77_18865 [Nannocystaceae bacterium]